MILPFKTNVLAKVIRWTSNGDSSGDTGAMDYEETLDLNDADVVTSRERLGRLEFTEGPDDDLDFKNVDPFHTPVLDIDFPAALVPSSTPGKYHLYLDMPMPWEKYVKLLDVMAEVGILEPGYVGASKARGFTAVRLPWVRKSYRPLQPDV